MRLIGPILQVAEITIYYPTTLERFSALEGCGPFGRATSTFSNDFKPSFPWGGQGCDRWRDQTGVVVHAHPNTILVQCT